MEPTNRAVETFTRMNRLAAARDLNAVEYAMLAALILSTVRQLYLRELPGQTREEFERDLLEMSYHFDALVSLGGMAKSGA